MALSNLYRYYKKEIVPKIMEEEGVENSLAVSRFKKIVLNVGLGEALKDKGVLNKVSKQLAIISGQFGLASQNVTGSKRYYRC